VLVDFHKQIEQSWELFEKSKLKINSAPINSILYIGLGGSAIAGNLMRDVLFDSLRVPLKVVQSYFVPGFCNASTLVVLSSYSGESEETLHAADLVAKTEAQVIVTTSGGRMGEMAKKNKWNMIKLPEGYPASQALGYLFFPIYHLLGSLNLMSDYKKNLKQLARFARETARRNDMSDRHTHNLSNELAQAIHKKIPVIYSTAPYLMTVSQRWQNRFTENSKSLAFSNVIPEMNHNEIVGWEVKLPAIKNFIVIFIENEDLHPRMQKRIDLTKEIIKKRGVEVVDIYASGKSLMEKVFSLVILGDWVSYYLGLSYGKDPLEVDNIDYLKTEMAKV
jgi:glucose/mannose-6-phosphate isomerase